MGNDTNLTFGAFMVQENTEQGKFNSKMAYKVFFSLLIIFGIVFCLIPNMVLLITDALSKGNENALKIELLTSSRESMKVEKLELIGYENEHVPDFAIDTDY